MAAKRILMACTNYWSSPFQLGTNQLARCFAKAGWEVAWISDPITPFHVLGGRSEDLIDRFRIYRDGGEYDFERQLWFYVPGAFFSPNNKPILRSALIHREWYRFTLPRLFKLVADHGFGHVDLLFLNSYSQAFWLDALTYKYSVLRIGDKSTAFSRFSPEMAVLEKEMAQKVDLVIYSAAGLTDYVDSLNPLRTLHLPNGVDFEHFQLRSEGAPIDYRTIPHPIAVYVGAFEYWFDFELIRFAAASLPEVSFVLIGPDYLATAYENFKSFPNIYLLGPRSYQEIPSFLHYADLGIIPFDVEHHPELVDTVNPLKLYEYLASGLPVVAVEWTELKTLNSPARLCRSGPDFVESVQDVIEDPPNSTLLIEYARQQDWSRRFDLLLHALSPDL
jgi:glycosyltransferase involved in cell wall biosynthesis